VNAKEKDCVVGRGEEAREVVVSRVVAVDLYGVEGE